MNIGPKFTSSENKAVLEHLQLSGSNNKRCYSKLDLLFFIKFIGSEIGIEFKSRKLITDLIYIREF